MWVVLVTEGARWYRDKATSYKGIGLFLYGNLTHEYRMRRKIWMHRKRDIPIIGRGAQGCWTVIVKTAALRLIYCHETYNRGLTDCYRVPAYCEHAMSQWWYTLTVLSQAGGPCVWSDISCGGDQMVPRQWDFQWRSRLVIVQHIFPLHTAYALRKILTPHIGGYQ